MPQNELQQSAHLTDVDNKRYCWVCYASDEDDENASWVKPCQCRGTTKWVHQSCLQRWVDEKQKGNSLVKVNCPQCGLQYIISFPNMGQLMLFLDRVDALIYKVCPFVAAGVVVGACYWVAVTYGAITVMQVIGYEKGMDIISRTDTLVLLMCLPTIPIMLVLSKMVRWEDKALYYIRLAVQKIPVLKFILPGFRNATSSDSGVDPTSTTSVISDPINATRVLCGALSLPTIASIIGRAFYQNCSTTLEQTLLGGVSFLIVKGLFKVYYKQQQHVMQKRRIIKDHPVHAQYEATLAAAAAAASAVTPSNASAPSASPVITTTTTSASATTTTTTTNAPDSGNLLLEAVMAGLNSSQAAARATAAAAHSTATAAQHAAAIAAANQSSPANISVLSASRATMPE